MLAFSVVLCKFYVQFFIGVVSVVLKTKEIVFHLFVSNIYCQQLCSWENFSRLLILLLLFVAPLSAGPPEIVEPEYTEMEETLENTVDLKCHVRGFPVPSITWTTSDGKVQQREASHSSISYSCNRNAPFFPNVCSLDQTLIFSILTLTVGPIITNPCPSNPPDVYSI